MTEPTGRSVGSAAAIPAWTPTPDFVMRPLQYAVATKSVVEPALSGPSTLGSDGRLAPRESMTVASYMSTKPAIVNAVASSFLRREREKCITRYPGHQ